MRCPQCEFENLPGRDRCLKCDSVLQAESTDIEIHPPRMARWKKPCRGFSREIRRCSKITPTGKDYFRLLPAPGWLKSLPYDVFWSFFLSTVPGLAHLLQRRFKEIRLFCLMWIIMIGLSVFFYGNSWGMLAIGLAVGLHAWIALHAGAINHIILIRRRIMALAIVSLCVWGFYHLIRSTLLHDFIGGYIQLDIPNYNIERGDFFLGRRSGIDDNTLSRGTLVLAHLFQTTRGNEAVVAEIIGLPHDTVDVKERVYVVNGRELDPNTYPVSGWLRNRSVSITIPEYSYFVSAEYRAGGELNDEFIINACLVQFNDIEARIFMRWLPLRRRGFLREFP